MSFSKSLRFLICLIFVFPLKSCTSQTENLIVTETKITKERLELFFEQNKDLYSINDVPFPIFDLKSTYHHFTLKPFRNTSLGWQAEDSIVYSENKFNEYSLSKSGKILEQKKKLFNGAFEHRKFMYDKNDKLIETQYLDRSLKVNGKINYIYSDDYSKMYKIANSVDTLRYYEFDSIGRVSNFVIYWDDVSRKMILSYNNEGLISNLIQTTNYKNESYEIKYEMIYKYNQLGDWIELLIFLEQNNHKEVFYKFLRELN